MFENIMNYLGENLLALLIWHVLIIILITRFFSGAKGS